MIEEWKLIPGYENTYEISTYGSVRRISHGHHTRPGKILKQYIHKKGYPRVRLSKNNIAKVYQIYELMALTFLAPRKDGLEIRHLDGDRLNSKLDNLKWGTRKENRHDRIKHGRNNEGSKHGLSKLTEDDVLSIRNRRASGEKLKSIASDYGINTTYVSSLVTGDRWKHVGGPFTTQKDLMI